MLAMKKLLFNPAYVILIGLFLTGCREPVSIYDSEPVIPLVEHKEGAVSDNKSDAAPSESLNENTEAVADDRAESDEAIYSSSDFPPLHLQGEYQEFLLEGVQLSEAELKDMSDYFNSSEVNAHLAQIYVIPVDFDEDLECEPVRIECVAGSIDSNGLYCIFYKKAGDDKLWNVVLRKDKDGNFVFHSNVMT